ncbi:MAG: TonB-dependent receptor domain-containing protein, partial [Leptospirales bacterium]
GGTATQCANPFMFNYIQGQGFKVGDIAETAIQTWKGNKVHLGMRLSYNNTLYQNEPIGTPNITGNAAGSNMLTTIGGYLEDHYRPTDEVLVSAGFRVMAINEQYANTMSGAQTSTNLANGGNGAYQPNAGESYVIPLPHVGVNYYPSDHWKLYANAGQSFSAPSIQFFELPPGSGTINVKPEIVNDVEIGARYTTDKGFVAFDLYNDYINNMFTTSLVTLPTGVTNVLPDSAGLAEMRGFEAQFKRDLKDGFSVDGSFSAVDAYFVSAQYGLGTSKYFSNGGDPLPFVPNMLGNLDLNYSKGNWHFTVNERYTGMMNVINTSGGPGCGGGTPVCSNIQENSPGYWATNLLLAYDLPKTTWYRKAQVFFNAFNLLNTNYYEPAGLVNGANAANVLMVYPGEPINVFGGVTLTF